MTDRADGIRRAKAFSPNVRMETAFVQYPNTGFSKYFNPSGGEPPSRPKPAFPWVFPHSGFRPGWSAVESRGEGYRRTRREQKVKWNSFHGFALSEVITAQAEISLFKYCFSSSLPGVVSNPSLPSTYMEGTGAGRPNSLESVSKRLAPTRSLVITFPTAPFRRTHRPPIRPAWPCIRTEFNGPPREAPRCV